MGVIGAPFGPSWLNKDNFQGLGRLEAIKRAGFSRKRAGDALSTLRTRSAASQLPQADKYISEIEKLHAQGNVSDEDLAEARLEHGKIAQLATSQVRRVEDPGSRRVVTVQIPQADGEIKTKIVGLKKDYGQVESPNIFKGEIRFSVRDQEDGEWRLKAIEEIRPSVGSAEFIFPDGHKIMGPKTIMIINLLMEAGRERIGLTKVELVEKMRERGFNINVGSVLSMVSGKVRELVELHGLGMIELNVDYSINRRSVGELAKYALIKKEVAPESINDNESDTSSVPTRVEPEVTVSLNKDEIPILPERLNGINFLIDNPDATPIDLARAFGKTRGSKQKPMDLTWIMVVRRQKGVLWPLLTRLKRREARANAGLSTLSQEEISTLVKLRGFMSEKGIENFWDFYKYANFKITPEDKRLVKPISQHVNDLSIGIANQTEVRTESTMPIKEEIEQILGYIEGNIGRGPFYMSELQALNVNPHIYRQMIGKSLGKGTNKIPIEIVALIMYLKRHINGKVAREVNNLRNAAKKEIRNKLGN